MFSQVARDLFSQAGARCKSQFESVSLSFQERQDMEKLVAQVKEGQRIAEKVALGEELTAAERGTIEVCARGGRVEMNS